MSLNLQSVPNLWKQVLLPKGTSPTAFNDSRTVAFSSLVMKTFEKLVNSELARETKHALDPRSHRGVEDAAAFCLNT